VVALRPLKPLKPLQPLTSKATPAKTNAMRLAVLAKQPQPNVAPQPVPHTLIAAYTAQLEVIADRSYRIADSTVIAAVRRQQLLAESWEAKQKSDADEPDPDEMQPGQRAAYQNKQHTPAQKRQLTLPFAIETAIAAMDRRMGEYALTIPIAEIVTKQGVRIEANAAAVNVRMLNSIGLQAIEPQSAIATARNAWVKENAALIRSQPAEVAQRIGAKVQEMVERGSRWETIAKELEAEHGIATNRAKLIARDQTSKYNGALNQAYQQEAGITHYQWRGAMDARERPTHVALQGLVFAWTDPPPVGHPGEDYACRCVGSPVVSATLIQNSTSVTSEQLAAKVQALGPQVKGGKPV
tara:strand:- start:8973 stop:10034 length:1062 start_codon:yes stop_codon:yes gene_type:complete